MSLFRRLFQAVGSWRRRRGGPKATPRAGVTVECLDHRRLLSVNFTGNVATDFPITTVPGVVRLAAGAGDQIAQPDVNLAPIIKVSGFAVNAIRVSYQPSDDSLSFGLEQPINPNLGTPVIAGDADNNGIDGRPDSGSVNPAVTAIDPSFSDPPDLDGTETMAVFLDLNNDQVADVVAGKDPLDPSVPKLYQVALAVPSPIPGARPGFGAPLPANTGNLYLVNDPRHPGFEFAINNFSQLFAAFNGGALPNAQSILNIGAFAGSTQDGSVSETFINFKSTPFGPTVLPNPCPPVSPPIQINPHENHHINTAHPTDVRVTFFGSSGFDVNQIVPESLRLGGAAPIFDLPARRINRDQFPDKTFVFRGTDIELPPGITTATVTGMLRDGTPIVTSMTVFNRDESFYTPRQQNAVEARRERIGPVADLTPFQRRALRAELVDRVLAERGGKLQETKLAADVARPVEVGTGPVVSIPMTHPRRNHDETSTVAIPTRAGRSVVAPRRLKIDTSRAARSR
jgi:hypothetical protein